VKLDVIVGGQYGSEAKGHVTQRVIERALTLNPDEQVVNIRVAGPNAGHTGHNIYGKAMAFRTLPIGALIPGVECVVAAGSEIQPQVLLNEIDAAKSIGFDASYLMVDREATVIEDRHHERETNAGLVHKLGSTGKGVGAARADRLMRQAKRVIDDGVFIDELEARGVRITNTAYDLALRSDDGRIVIEGTQGFGLGLHAGLYPHCTSSDCRAIDFMSMAGVMPWQFDYTSLKVWVTCRVFPIRVAGNSGPMTNETSWDALGLPTEYTTVTKKPRRVGYWDQALVRAAVLANGGAPTVALAITMLDQLFPNTKGIKETHKLITETDAMAWLTKVQDESYARIELVTTGPNTGVFL